MNTLDLYRGRDHLDTVAAARAALSRHGPPVGPSTIRERDLATLRAARAAIRGLLSGEPESLQPFRITAHLSIGRTGSQLLDHPKSVDGYLTRMIFELYVAERNGSFQRLKLCANSSCTWAFWDTSRPGTGKWCSMLVCGGQRKAREYRARRRAGGQR